MRVGVRRVWRAGTSRGTTRHDSMSPSVTPSITRSVCVIFFEQPPRASDASDAANARTEPLTTFPRRARFLRERRVVRREPRGH